MKSSGRTGSRPVHKVTLAIWQEPTHKRSTACGWKFAAKSNHRFLFITGPHRRLPFFLDIFEMSRARVKARGGEMLKLGAKTCQQGWMHHQSMTACKERSDRKEGGWVCLVRKGSLITSKHQAAQNIKLFKVLGGGEFSLTSSCQ